MALDWASSFRNQNRTSKQQQQFDTLLPRRPDMSGTARLDQIMGRNQTKQGSVAAGESAAAQVLAATDLESAGLDPVTGFEQFRKRKTTGGGSSAAAAMLGF